MEIKTIIKAICSAVLMLFIILTAVYPERYFLGELRPNETVQHILLFIIILSQIATLTRACEKQKRRSALVKLVAFGTLFYEEISFLTANRFESVKEINFQNELNLHNMNILYTPFSENLEYLKQIPFLDDLSLIFLLQILLAIMLGMGHLTKKNSFLWHIGLTKDMSIYSLCYLGNHYSPYLLAPIAGVNTQLLHQELLETFIYLIFAADIVIKQQNSKKLTFR